MYEWLINQIQNNQFMSGAIGGSLFYAAINYARSIGFYIYYRMLNFFIREITVSSYDSTVIYNQLLDFVTSRVKHPQNIGIKSNISAHNATPNEYYDEDEDGNPLGNEKNILKPTLSYGRHWFWYNFYTFVRVSISVEEHHANTKSDIIKIQITSLFSRTIRNELSKLFIDNYQEKTRKPTMYEVGQYGIHSGKPNHRELDSIFIDEKIKDKINDALQSLEDNADIYKRAGMNRVLGIMLYGKPGTGKTSYIQALARATGRNIYYADLSQLCEAKITRLRNIQPNSFIVLEDIDSIPSFRKRDSSEKDQVDLSKILKMLDGVYLPDNTVIFATTNHFEKIDPAVKRFGRFDLHFEFEYADRELAEKMINYIDSSKLHLLDKFEYPISQAQVQAIILKSIKGYEDIPEKITPFIEDQPNQTLIENKIEENSESEVIEPIKLSRRYPPTRYSRGRIRRVRFARAKLMKK